ncbi:hypothetical protein Fmac_015713 [Flemingia macrophylla]|uniref:non-specific serine/threonine protein kinase n=1 Tax=Flemingia macrophylla TaxID=520843 RepID=A0ABD1MFB6_9FABA
MASLNILFLFIVLILATSEAQEDDPSLINQNCSSEKTNFGTPFHSNLKTLLSSLLPSKATEGSKFYNTTITDKNPSDSVYGVFMCRGDLPPTICSQCVLSATRNLLSECSLNKEAVIWYNECMVRYSYHSFFSTMVTAPSCSMANKAQVSNSQSFMSLLESTVNQTAQEASHHQNKYATGQKDVSDSNSSKTLYCLAQCTPDLSPNDCNKCLSEAIGELSHSREGRIGARVLYPSCNIRYELYPFYYSMPPSPEPVPETNADSKSSHDGFVSQNCSTNTMTTIPDSLFQKHLKTLLSYLSLKASIKSFYRSSVANNVYGLFMCRRDLPSKLCQHCVQNAVLRVSPESECHSSEAVIWYDDCMVRYSSKDFSTISTRPRSSKLNITSTIQEHNSFVTVVANTLDEAMSKARQNQRYGTKSSKLNDEQTVYALAQCTGDLSADQCWECLGYILGTEIEWSRLGSVGGRVLYPSCNIRFELHNFYENHNKHTLSPTAKKILIVVVVFASVMILSIRYSFLRRKARNSFGHESVSSEALQFTLGEIKIATNNFSNENKIGRGGFGEVYKGFIDGQRIAVKRLSRNSNQGVNEFKNEISLIAKLQHTNLVRLIGYCVEEQEKMLIYEYLSNKSLDYFLFDTQQGKKLNWLERYNIIKGIAQGILYLHEYSRLKVIHRDLKSSNVLLDENFNPKVSDFGLARIIETSQDQRNTSRIVGTFGYMSPEYAMFGEFSEKSDVYSFGVMILEIITGKKNLGSYESHRSGDNLLSYVWKHWKDQTPLLILDPNVEDSNNEVLKCIQIGLLCVQLNPDTRPTIVTINSYLNSHVIELPIPQEPAIFFGGRSDTSTNVGEPFSIQSTNHSMSISMDKVSTSENIPR